MSDHTDLSAREKARIMERNLEAHNQRRRELGIEQRPVSIRTPWDRDPDATPAPTFWRDDTGVVDPDSRPPSYSAQRRAARFTDGLPPPPPPSAPEERRRALQAAQLEADARARAGLTPDPILAAIPGNYGPPLSQRQRKLIPPDLFDRLEAVRPQPTLPPLPRWPAPESRPPEYAPMPAPPDRPLNDSQKRRRRRQKARLAPYPLQPDTSATNSYGPAPCSLAPSGDPFYPGQPVAPTHPEIDISTACNHPITLSLSPGHPPVTLYCPMKPYPHTGQAHLVQLPATPEAPEVFLGWFGPGE